MEIHMQTNIARQGVKYHSPAHNAPGWSKETATKPTSGQPTHTIKWNSPLSHMLSILELGVLLTRFQNTPSLMYASDPIPSAHLCDTFGFLFSLFIRYPLFNGDHDAFINGRR